MARLRCDTVVEATAAGDSAENVLTRPAAQDVSSPIFMNPLRKSTLLDPKVAGRGARKQRALSSCLDEGLHCRTRDAAPPPLWINPVGQLAVALNDEVDHPGEHAILLIARVVLLGFIARVRVSIERGSVPRVGAGERRHPGPRQIAPHRKRSSKSSSCSSKSDPHT